MCRLLFSSSCINLSSRRAISSLNTESPNSRPKAGTGTRDSKQVSMHTLHIALKGHAEL